MKNVLHRLLCKFVNIVNVMYVIQLYFTNWHDKYHVDYQISL